jgi:putative nucleotidyltransferase with HDIG domain
LTRRNPRSPVFLLPDARMSSAALQLSLFDTQPVPPRDERLLRDAEVSARWLHRWFAADFTVFDGHDGTLLVAAAQPAGVAWDFRTELCRQVAAGGRAAIIADDDPLLALAVPVRVGGDRTLVGVAWFVSRSGASREQLHHAAAGLGISGNALAAWAATQTPRDAALLEQLSDLVMAKLCSDERVASLENEIEKLSSHLNSTFEEINLIYRVTGNLRISENKEDLGRSVLSWLEDVVPAEGLAMQFTPQHERDRLTGDEAQPLLLATDQCPIDNARFSALLNRLGDSAAGVLVLNQNVTSEGDWPFPQLRQLILVPITEGKRRFGWLAAFNHRQQAEFGSVEANLLNSVAAILAIHSSNIDLYKQQADMLADVVRAMSLAIDAKDPYTRGHSDRVARVAVRLAQEMGCGPEVLKNIYLAGLLHDIGKIGIDDNVLRKPGKLTDAEFEHVKQHTEIGHRILRDLRNISSVLPVVLHHHESWDGRGYPYGLVGESIPFLARIVAVADAYDAMASDRPYRTGMPDERLDQIIRDGADQQWDPQVVAAFFRARDAIREISKPESSRVDAASLQWS